MSSPPLACLLLAAGGSKRLGQAKQLIEMHGETLVRRAAGLLLARSANVVVVTGAQASRVARELEGLAVTCVVNDAWQEGMGGSIATGMHVLGDQPAGVLIMLCDQWRIDDEDLDTLTAAWRQRPGLVAAASWDGNYGAPAIFPRQVYPDLRNLRGETGAKGLIRREPTANFVDIPHARHDLDTWEDLAQWGSVD